MTLNALVHSLFFLELPFGLEFLNAPGSLRKCLMTNIAVTEELLMKMVRKGHTSKFSALKQHIFGALVFASGCRKQENKEAWH